MNEVVVVGAGPVGLMLAIELATAGVRSVVLERLAERNRTIKAAGVGAVGGEVLERRGFAAAMAEEEQRTAATFQSMLKARFAAGSPVKRPGGHFSAIFGIDRELQRFPERRMRMIPQEALEEMLGVRAAELGVEVRRGVVVEGLTQDAHSVTLETSAGPVRGRYVVGCDGGRSAVRKLAGIDFVGTDPTLTFLQAVVELDVPSKVPPGWHRTPRGLFTVMPGSRLFTVEFDGGPKDRDAPVTVAELEGALQRVSGTDVKVVKMEMASRWSDVARQAATYRSGRVFVAGDAAHVHSPLGGQGLNLGLVDAANLGWKLAAALRGREELLDTYEAERAPVAAAVLENTRAQVALLRPDELTSALRKVVAEVMKLPDANRFFGEMLTGIGTRYALGSDDPAVGTLVGDRDLALASGETVRLYALMGRGGGVLVAPDVRAVPPGVAMVQTREGPAMLVRPDGVVAWTDSSVEAVEVALARWF